MTVSKNHTDPSFSAAKAASSASSTVIIGKPKSKTATTTKQRHEKDFSAYGVSPAICQALADHGITTPFPIQALTLPVALKGQDIIGQAKTGTGKTLGFALPILEKVLGPKDDGFTELKFPGHPQAAVILPTRELAKQVAEEIRKAAANLSARVCEIYGGVGFEHQLKQIATGCEIVVGTPGRLLDLIRSKQLSLSEVKTVVLDEADEMLDLGFLPDVETLLAKTATSRQTMLFSATMPATVVTLARRHMHHPTHIRASSPQDEGLTVKNTTQVVYRTHSLNKLEVITRILQAKNRGLTIIFTRTKRAAARLSQDLDQRGFATAPLHGDLNQPAREQALRAFRKGKVDVLVATDVAARGIDVENVTHVINYQTPEDAKTYVHRIGRTGRAGESGTAITFVDWEDVPRWRLIDRELNLQLPEPIETYHTSAHLYTDLDIPTEVTGRLPRALRTRAGLSAEKLQDLSSGHSGKNRRKGKTSPRPTPGDGKKNATKSSRRPRKRIRKTPGKQG